MTTLDRAEGSALRLRRRTLLQAGAAAVALAGASWLPQSALAGAGYLETTWGRINLDVPDGTPTDAPFYQDSHRHYPNLGAYWLPDEPPATMPGMRALWQTLGQATGGGALRYVMVVEDLHSPFTQKGPFAPQPVHIFSQMPELPFSSEPLPALSRLSRSPNWSGAYVRATSARMFTRIIGRWTVPAITRGPSNNLRREYRTSVWIGFDGQRAFKDSSLPQVGTSHRIDRLATVAQHQAWFEWWENPGVRRPVARRLPIYIDDSVLPIAVGDCILCWMDVLPGDALFPHNMVRIFLKNETQNIFVLPFYLYAPTSLPTVTGETANWIVERPSFQGRVNQFLMPQFTNALAFYSCLAGSSPTQDGTADMELTLAASKRIKLFQPIDGNTRAETIATPTPSGLSSFAVAVRGS